MPVHRPSFPGRARRRPAVALAMLLVLSLLGAIAAPVTAQTPVAVSTGELVELAPAESLFFLSADTRFDSPQVQQAAALIERAGLADMLEDTDQLLDVEIGVVVTSFPEPAAVDADDLLDDPMASTDVFSVVLDMLEAEAVVLVRGENAQALYEEARESLESELEFGTGEIVESEYGGVTISTYQPDPADEWATPEFVALMGDVVISGNDPANAEPVIDVWNGEAESITTNARFNEVSSLLPGEALSRGFIDGDSILAELEATYPDELATAGDGPVEALDAWTGFSFSAEERGFRLETRSISAGEPFEALTPIDGAFFDKVPSDALLAINGSEINGDGYVTLIAFLLASQLMEEELAATPVADVTEDITAAQDAAFAEAEKLLGFNLKTDFADLLTGEFGLSLALGDITAETVSIDALIVSEVSDPNHMRDTVSRVAFIAGAGLGNQSAIEDREINGSRVNVVDISDTGVADSVAFGVVDDELVIAVGSGLDDYESGAPSPMSADPTFTALMEELPGEYGSVTYINMPAVLQVLLGISGSMVPSEDAHESCAEFGSQEEAQAAFDEDPFANFDLDQDFDSQACEDYFADGTASPAPAEEPYGNVAGLAMVTTQEDGVNGTSTFLLITGD